MVMRKLKITPELRISLIYIGIGFAWILLSGKFVLILTDDIHTINLIETYKGWFFVVITGFLLYLLIKRDIQKRNKIAEELKQSKERAEESNRLKSAFILNLSHEIRTPLNAIMGFSDLLRKEGLSPDKRNQFIRYIQLRGDDLINIINDLIDISKIESNTLEINKREFNLNKLLDELYDYYTRLQLKNTNKDLQLNIHKPLPSAQAIIFNDEYRLKQIFNNLLNNAFKFTEKGIINYGYKIEDDRIICFVSDTGIGISEKNAHYIFQRFLQIDSTLTRKSGGLGIGLSISKSLVEMMDGKMWLDTEEGKGSTFYFSFLIS